MIGCSELRVGNYHNVNGIRFWVTELTNEGIKSSIINPNGEMLTVSTKYESAEPIVLTEKNIMELRVALQMDFRPLVFSKREPGERQIENQFWSVDFNDDYKLHLTPSYDYEYNKGGNTPPQKTENIKFWFCWISNGYGGPSVSLKPIRGNVLKYVHQLQNLWHSLTETDLVF